MTLANKSAILMIFLFFKLFYTSVLTLSVLIITPKNSLPLANVRFFCSFALEFKSNPDGQTTVKRRSTDGQPTVKAYVTPLFNPYKNHIISYGYAAIYYYI